MISELEVHTPPFRFQIGELTFWAWRPRLLAWDASNGGVPIWRQCLPDSVRTRADGLLCRRLPPGELPVGISRQGPWIAYVRGVSKCYCVRIEGTFEEYLARFSSKRRHNLKRSVRVFQEKLGGSRFTVAKSPEEMVDFHRTALEISRRTYQAKLLNAGLPEGADYLRHTQDLASRGMARGYLLWSDQRAVAFAWCEGEGCRLHYSIIGYLPDYAAMSPGTVLLYLILEDLFREKVFRILDFGVGESWYKASFATGVEEFVDAALLVPTMRNVLLARLHRASEIANAAAGFILEKVGVKQWIKRLMRKFASARDALPS